MSKYSLESVYILPLSLRETGVRTGLFWSLLRALQCLLTLQVAGGSAGVIALESLFFFNHFFSPFFHFIYSPGRHRERILSFFHWLLWWSHYVHPHCWHKSESVLIQQRYPSVCGRNPSYKLLRNVLTCPSFRVICPCSLQPIKVRWHLNTLSPALTWCAKDAGKKPILSSITPWNC